MTYPLLTLKCALHLLSLEKKEKYLMQNWYIHNAFNQKGTKDTQAVTASCWLSNKVKTRRGST